MRPSSLATSLTSRPVGRRENMLRPSEQGILFSGTTGPEGNCQALHARRRGDGPRRPLLGPCLGTVASRASLQPLRFRCRPIAAPCRENGGFRTESTAPQRHAAVLRDSPKPTIQQGPPCSTHPTNWQERGHERRGTLSPTLSRRERGTACPQRLGFPMPLACGLSI